MPNIRKTLLSTFLIISFLFQYSHAQKAIEGFVYDADTKQPLAGVSVLELETYETTDTDSTGYFRIDVYDTTATFYLNFLHVEYETREQNFDFSQALPLKIYLQSEQTFYDEVVITRKRQKYRNKNNPAVELIRKTTAKRHENDILKNGIFQYEYYEKVNVGVSRVPRFITHNFILKPFRFIFENYDSVNYPGHKNLTIYLEENWGRHSTNSKKNKSKKHIHHQKKISLDPTYINEEGTIAQLKHLYQDINIYDDNLVLVTNSFLSPIGTSSPQFYKFFIQDTVKNEQGHRIVHLLVEPRNKQDMLLFGDLYIDIDNNHSVAAYQLETTKSTNINFVEKVSIEAEYLLHQQNSKYHLNKYNNLILFSLYSQSKRKMIGSRSIQTKEFRSVPDLPDSLFSDPPVEIDKNHVNNVSDSSFYRANRTIPFTIYEQRTYDNLDSMRNMRYFKSLVDWGSALTSGYKKVGRFDIGPFYRFYSYNDVDRHRLRFGMRTNPHQFKRMFASGYIAYTTAYSDIRYNLMGIYSLKDKRIYEYPMSYLRVMAQHDVKLQGRIGEISVQDNIIESIQRGENDRFILVNNYKLDYVQEFRNNLVVTTYAMYNNLRPRGALYFTKNNGHSLPDTIGSLRNSAIGIDIRWSPGEVIYNDRTGRSRLHGRHPIFTLSAEKGLSGILDSDIDYTKLSATITKRNFLGPLGFLEYKLTGQYIFGTAPYPLLIVPRANQTYTYSGESYNMMNNGEFISDRQAELIVNWRTMGFFFNKIPLLRHLKLREAVGIKVLYGSLSDRNNPLYNPGVFTFPVDINNQPYIHEFRKNTPYIEWNVGVENIFKFLRIDYVRRINYLNHRNTREHGINFSVIIDF